MGRLLLPPPPPSHKPSPAKPAKARQDSRTNVRLFVRDCMGVIGGSSGIGSFVFPAQAAGETSAERLRASRMAGFDSSRMAARAVVAPARIVTSVGSST